MGVNDGEAGGVGGPELPPDVVQVLGDLGRRFLAALDSIGSAFLPVKPLENLDFKLPEVPVFKLNLPDMVPDLAIPRDEVRIMLDGLEVGRARFDGSAIHGEILDAGTIEQLRAGLLGGVSVGPFYEENLRAIKEELDMGLRGKRPEEERRMVEDKSLPVWEVPGLPGPTVVAEFGEYKPVGVPVVRVYCSTTEHGERPAVVTGRFRVPWWPEDREEHAAYCHTCARLAVFLGYFRPDHEGWR